VLPFQTQKHIDYEKLPIGISKSIESPVSIYIDLSDPKYYDDWTSGSYTTVVNNAVRSYNCGICSLETLVERHRELHALSMVTLYITFDNAPNDTITKELLQILQQQILSLQNTVVMVAFAGQESLEGQIPEAALVEERMYDPARLPVTSTSLNWVEKWESKVARRISEALVSEHVTIPEKDLDFIRDVATLKKEIPRDYLLPSGAKLETYLKQGAITMSPTPTGVIVGVPSHLLRKIVRFKDKLVGWKFFENMAIEFFESKYL